MAEVHMFKFNRSANALCKRLLYLKRGIDDQVSIIYESEHFFSLSLNEETKK
jgi:hypothetical protein